MAISEHRVSATDSTADQAHLLALAGNLNTQQQTIKQLCLLQDTMTTQVNEVLDEVLALERQREKLIMILTKVASEKSSVPPALAKYIEMLQLSPSKDKPEVSTLPHSSATRAGVPARQQDSTQSFSQSSNEGCLHATAPSTWAHPAVERPLSVGFSETSSRDISTLMIRGVPRGCTQEQLAQFWRPDSEEFPYNLLYAPHRKSRNGLQGYVFINFLSAEIADRFRATWDGVQPHGCEMIPAEHWKRPLEIRLSEVQGLAENLESFVQVDLGRLSQDMWPVVFVDGKRQTFLEAHENFLGKSDSRSDA